MTPNSDVSKFTDLLDCFGDYTKSDRLCANHCVLRLGCAIEKDHNIRMEILSDLAVTEGRISNIQ
jgi:hypothetical protein